MTTASRPFPAPGRILLWLAAFAFLLWSAGLAAFLVMIARPVPTPGPDSVDGIIVLTGGNGRIQAGLAALESRAGRRLLISGVNPDLDPSIIRSAIGGSHDLAACCIDLGSRARNTEGNATEALEWADRHGFDAIAVVTSDWHMSRALVEFRRIDPRRHILPLPVRGEAGALRLLAEYNKYLFARTRAALGRDRP